MKPKSLNRICSKRGKSSGRNPIVFAVFLLGINALFLLNSCVSPPDSEPSPSDVNEIEPEVTSEPSKNLPHFPLSADLLNDLLIAELSYYRNDVETSIEILEKLAFETRDPRIAQTVSLRALSDKRFDVAYNTTALWIDLEPGSSSAWFAGGVAQVATEQIEESVASFKQVLVLSEADQASAINNISRTLGSSLSPEIAYQIMVQVLDDYSYTVPSLTQLIRLALSAGEGEAVIEGYLIEAFKIAPDSDDVANIQFSLYLEFDKKSEALSFAQSFLEEYPQSRRLRTSYADHLSSESLYQEAVEQYEFIGDADSIFKLGNLHERANYPELAYEQFLQYLELEPDNQSVYINLAEVAMSLGKYDEALQWIGRLSGRNLEFSRRLLSAYYIAGTDGIEDAVAFLGEYSPRSDTEKIRIYLTLDNLYRKAGTLESAKKVMDDALVEYPDNATLLLARSLTASELNLIPLVEQDIRAVLDQQPNNPHALNALGYTLADQTDRFMEASELIQKALDVRPNDPYILDSMGWLEFKIGNYERAIELLKLALTRRDDPVIAAHLGEVYWVQGRKSLARKIWDQATKKSPDDTYLQKTIDRLTN